MAASHPVTIPEKIHILQASTLIAATGTGSTGAALIIVAVLGRHDLAEIGLYLLGVSLVAGSLGAVMQCIAATSTHTQTLVVENRALLTTYDEQIETAIGDVQRTGRNILLAADVLPDDDLTRRRNRHHN